MRDLFLPNNGDQYGMCNVLKNLRGRCDSTSESELICGASVTVREGVKADAVACRLLVAASLACFASIAFL
jgi:hypothetical protein